MGVMAQENIHFVAGAPTQDGISEKVKNAMKLKVEQIIARNNAGANSLYNAFVIVPELTITDTRSTEGLIRDVTLLTGEFTLTAKNRYDDSIYGNVIIEVSGDATGNQEAAMAALLNGIKSNNPAFLRFIRTTRKRIVEYYEQNCQTIVLKAQTMINMQQYDEAMAYLSSVPETVSCYTEATQLLETSFSGSQVLDCDKKLRSARSLYIRRNYEEALILLQDISSSSPCGDDAAALMDSIAKYIQFNEPDKPVEPVQPEDDELIEEVLEPLGPLKPRTPVIEEEPQYTVSISCNGLQFEVVSCEGNTVSQTITLYGKFVNEEAKVDASIYMETVITPDGGTLTQHRNVAAYGTTADRHYIPMPTGIKVGKVFEIRDVVKKFDTLAYVEIAARGCKVIIRDLPVTWK
ncbi:hypothetical protein D0T85_08310 [Bacteroides sp. 519]|nr:hypothetical protein [Bacteroides sp. 519]